MQEILLHLQLIISRASIILTIIIITTIMLGSNLNTTTVIVTTTAITVIRSLARRNITDMTRKHAGHHSSGDVFEA